MGHIIGIDLGTTNSLVCIWRDGKTEMIPNSLGEYLTPSVVSFGEDGTVYVGAAAKERLVSYPDTTFASFKRFMGKDKPAALKGHKPEELSALVLKKLKSDAEKYLGETVTEAIISVPAYFDDKARKATKLAGSLAGLEVNRIINEPSAAALSYLKCVRNENVGNPDEEFEEHAILVFDFGGGTLDVSLVDTFENVVEIISVSGNNALGGIDFDKAIADYFIEKNGLNVIGMEKNLYNVILKAAEQVKRELTEKKSAVMSVSMPKLSAQLEISNKELIHIAENVLKKLYKPIQDVIRDSGRGIETITDVVLVGGSSRMPVVQYYLKKVMNREDIEVVDPDNMIAKGVGVYAGIKERDAEVKDMILTDVCPFSLGVDVHNTINPKRALSSFIISRNTALPVSRTDYYYSVEDNQPKALFNIFQGEEMYADQNKSIGKLEIMLPPNSKKGTQFKVTFSYDLNGILVVDVEVPEYDIKKNKVIVDSSSELSEKEIKETVDKLNQIKFMANDDEEDIRIMQWGERLFAQSKGEARAVLEQRMMVFAGQLKNVKDMYQLNRIRKYMKMFLVYFETSLFRLNGGEDVNYDEYMDEDDMEIDEIFKDFDKDKDE